MPAGTNHAPKQIAATRIPKIARAAMLNTAIVWTKITVVKTQAATFSIARSATAAKKTVITARLTAAVATAHALPTATTIVQAVPATAAKPATTLFLTVNTKAIRQRLISTMSIYL